MKQKTNEKLFVLTIEESKFRLLVSDGEYVSPLSISPYYDIKSVLETKAEGVLHSDRMGVPLEFFMEVLYEE